MASKYDELARIITQNAGGKQNINSITRLRFKPKDESKANTEILNQNEKIDGVLKVIQVNG